MCPLPSPSSAGTTRPGAAGRRSASSYDGSVGRGTPRSCRAGTPRAAAMFRQKRPRGEPMSRLVLQPSKKHPITIEQSTEKVTVSLGGRAIATSDQALVLREASYPPIYYVPAQDIEP